jgi:ankyrin repeat protein
LEPGGSIVVGTVIVKQGKVVRPSQLIASVGQTKGVTRVRDELVRAVAEGSTRRVRDLLRAGVGPNATQRGTGRTVLSVAASCGQLAVVRLLLRHGALANRRFRYVSPVTRHVTSGMVPLMDASGAPRIASALLKAGASPNVQDARGWTTLMRAAVGGHTEVVGVLLAAGADACVRTRKGETARDLVKGKLAWYRAHVTPGRGREARRQLRSILGMLTAAEGERGCPTRG